MILLDSQLYIPEIKNDIFCINIEHQLTRIPLRDRINREVIQ